MLSTGYVAIYTSSGHMPKPLEPFGFENVIVIAVLIYKAVLIVPFLTRSRSFTSEMALSHRISNASNFLPYSDFIIHVSVTYVAIERMRVLYILTFRGFLISPFCQIGIYSLTNAVISVFSLHRRNSGLRFRGTQTL